ncbi:MAG: DUF4176 domain-containing protein [Clostridiales bacterium]|nr:DUF4176 domain-containing protein [Clostridiales bacterium]
MLMNDVRQLLPIGSVVKLKGAEKCLMTFGVRQTDVKSGKEYDYIGVMYPEGNLGEDLRFMFDHEDISEIIYKGYESDELTAFLEKLNNFFANKEDA